MAKDSILLGEHGWILPIFPKPSGVWSWAKHLKRHLKEPLAKWLGREARHLETEINLHVYDYTSPFPRCAPCCGVNFMPTYVTWCAFYAKLWHWMNWVFQPVIQRRKRLRRRPTVDQLASSTAKPRPWFLTPKSSLYCHLLFIFILFMLFLFIIYFFFPLVRAGFGVST